MLKARHIIIEIELELAASFGFTRVPTHSFDEKDPEAITITLRMLPFVLAVTTALFTTNVVWLVLEQYVKHVSKRPGFRQVALVSLGDFLLLDPQRLAAAKKVQKLKRRVRESTDDSRIVYTMIGIVAFHSEWSNEQANMLLSKSLDTMNVKGWCRFVRHCTARADEAHRRLQSFIVAALFGDNQPEAVIVDAYWALVKLEIDYSMFALPLIIQCSPGLRQASDNVREAVAWFVTGCRRSTGSMEIAMVTLSAVCCETNNTIALQVLNDVNLTEVDADTVKLLETLLCARNRKVRNQTLRIIAQRASRRKNGEILSGSLDERIPDRLSCVLISKGNIACFLILTSNLGATKHLSVPFARFPMSHLLGYRSARRRHPRPQSARFGGAAAAAAPQSRAGCPPGDRRPSPACTRPVRGGGRRGCRLLDPRGPGTVASRRSDGQRRLARDRGTGAWAAGATAATASGTSRQPPAPVRCQARTSPPRPDRRPPRGGTRPTPRRPFRRAPTSRSTAGSAPPPTPRSRPAARPPPRSRARRSCSR